MHENPLVSIIVPVYKVENYLKKCIDSITNQTYTNLEILLVDDGSPDNCPKICDDYASLDDRIKVIHKKNGGLSDARNVGMKIAKGEYIGFVDSDDWIDSDMYKILVGLILKYNADIAECGLRFVFPDRTIETDDNKITILENTKAIECFLDRSIDIKGSVWNKLYKKSIIANLNFPIGKLHEDAFFTYKALYSSKKYVRIESSCYNYLQERPGSIMSVKVKPINILTVIEAFEERNVFFKAKNEEILYLKSKAYYYGTLVSEYKNVTLNLYHEKEIKKILKHKLIANFKDIIKNPYTNNFRFILFRIISLVN